MKTVSIVVPVYNEEDNLVGFSCCLDSGSSGNGPGVVIYGNCKG